MRTWNTKINGNDTFQDIYQNFFDLYNQGKNPVDISKQIQEDFGDKNNSLLTTGLTKGMFTVSYVITGTGIEEVTINKNSDTDKINYFKK